MILSFIAVSTPEPIGGNAVIYELAGAMADRGHEVHLFHTNVYGDAVASLDEIPWFRFHPRITHHFPGKETPPPQDIPSADIIFGYRSEEALLPHEGLPVVLIQGYKMVGESLERHAYGAPCPKVCVARWLVDVGREWGVPDKQLVHVPCALRHETFRVLTDIADRPEQLSFCYNAHIQKGSKLALEVCAELHDQRPDLSVVAYGSFPPHRPIPDWMSFRLAPTRAQLVEEILNHSRIFLFTSHVEGFGLSALEAMACGAALVTTDNGGSRDYALQGETALVSPPGDADGLVANALRLLHDDAERVALAWRGVEYAQRFTWPNSATRLEHFLEEYLADPVAFGRPPAAEPR
jgi:glycosyltransferase involved in cell wall biosynthesis